MVKFLYSLKIVDWWNSSNLITAAKITKCRSFAVSNYLVGSSYKNSVQILLAKAAHWSSSNYWGYRKDGTAAACSPNSKHGIEIAHSKMLFTGDFGCDCIFRYPIAAYKFCQVA